MRCPSWHLERDLVERSLLSLRSTLVFLLALLTGVGAGVLTIIAGRDTLRGVLYGAAAVGLAVPFFDRVVAADHRAPDGREPGRHDAGGRDSGGDVGHG
jgi:hypothetical protein